MGFAVLHIQKPKGYYARTTAHIERTVQPANAVPERKDLNKEFIRFPKGLENRRSGRENSSYPCDSATNSTGGKA